VETIQERGYVKKNRRKRDYSAMRGGIVFLNMEDGTVVKIPINDSLTVRFHAISISAIT
jgi:hypothetical protein